MAAPTPGMIATPITDDERELSLIVDTKTAVAEGVTMVTFRDPDGAPLPRWSPGAHIDVRLTPDITRQYSLCGEAGDRSTWQIAVLREPAGRGGSMHLHEQVMVGDTLAIRGPRNHFRLEPAQDYLFIAGGIGITPIMAMVAEADRVGARWSLAYGGRSRASMAFADELAARHPDRVTVVPQDEVGMLDLDGLVSRLTPETAVYACGPGGLLDALAERSPSWSGGSLHVERFSAGAIAEPVLQSSFEVELALTGRTITVEPDESVLDALTSAGIEVLSSCTEGICGTCETPVLDGIVDHRDSLLNDAERDANDTMMVCVSRANCPRLVLEL